MPVFPNARIGTTTFSGTSDAEKPCAGFNSPIGKRADPKHTAPDVLMKSLLEHSRFFFCHMWGLLLIAKTNSC
jgi:hypothetical protein